MGYIVRMPKLGMEMQKGELLEWHVSEGEGVERDEVIAEIESEKAVTEVTAREAGVLREQLLQSGETVEPGTAMGVIAGEQEDVEDLLAEADHAPAATDGTDAAASERGDGRTDEGTAEGTMPVAGEESERVRASPKARKLAAEQGVDLASVDGSGPRGAVVAVDVESVAGASADKAETATSDSRVDSTGRTVRERREFDGMRTTIADRLGESYRNAVHVTVDREIDVEELLSATSVVREALDEEASPTDVLLVAISEALSSHPAFNATYEDGVHTLYEEQHVGIAVDVDDGLVTPVLRDLQDRSLREIARERTALTDLALDGEYHHADLAGGTFTVSNLGTLGVDSFTPIIDPPQIAILGLNRIREVARPGEDGTGVEFRRRMTVSLSFDHRVVDGADAARFLKSLADAVENPWPLLFERA